MKRLFALVLCICLFVCALSAPVLASPKVFTDADSVAFGSEGSILVVLGVISGLPDGSFQPNRMLSRAEAAVILARLDGFTNPARSADAADHWASGYIAYCLNNGLMTNAEGNDFRPNLNITARDFCAALLKLIGYDSLTAAELPAQITKCNLLAGFNGTLDSFVSRDYACLICYNAVCNFEIAEWRDGIAYYYTDELLNPITILEHRYGVVRYSQVVTANEYADLTQRGAHLDSGLTKLAEHRAFAVSTDLSFVGRLVDVYVRDGEVIGAPHISSGESSAVFSSCYDFLSFIQRSELVLTSETDYYLNYNLATRDILAGTYDRCEIIAVDHDRDGAFDIVLLRTYQKAKVSAVDPLTLTFADQSTAVAQTLAQPQDFALGDEIYAMQIAGVWYFSK